MLGQGKVELVHLGFIRGRDIKNSIIMCSEAENMTKEHIQLLLGRVGEGSSLWMNGDYKQVDGDVFLKNSGLIPLWTSSRGIPVLALSSYSKQSGVKPQRWQTCWIRPEVL